MFRSSMRSPVQLSQSPYYKFLDCSVCSEHMPALQFPHLCDYFITIISASPLTSMLHEDLVFQRCAYNMNSPQIFTEERREKNEWINEQIMPIQLSTCWPPSNSAASQWDLTSLSVHDSVINSKGNKGDFIHKEWWVSHDTAGKKEYWMRGMVPTSASPVYRTFRDESPKFRAKSGNLFVGEKLSSTEDYLMRAKKASLGDSQ